MDKTNTIALLALVLVAGIAFASDPPQSAVNPQNQQVETTDATPDTVDLDIRVTVDPGQGQPPVTTFLTSNSEEDRSPRIAIKDNGDSWVAWWRDVATDEIVVRRRLHGQSTWESEQIASDNGESSRAPVIAFDGNAGFIAYELDASGGDTSIALVQIDSEPDPYQTREIFHTTAYGGDVDVDIQAVDGHLWISWVDSAEDVGWSEYDEATDNWSTIDYESYVNETPADARSRIRSEVLGI